MNQIKLKNPLLVNGKNLRLLTYDTDKITVEMFGDAEAHKLKATAKRGATSAGAFELDYTMHLYLGMMAVIAVNPEIDIADLERLTGVDMMEVMRVGRNFIAARSEEDSPEDSSDEL